MFASLHKQDNQNSYHQSFQKDQQGFVQKVFGIVGAQLLTTSSICILACLSDAFFQFQLAHTWIYILAAITTIVTISMLLCKCCGSYKNKHPTNMILLSIFTLAESYTVSSLCAFYDVRLVAMAMVLTAIVTIGIVLFASTTAIRLHPFRAGFNVLLISLFGAGILLLFINIPLLEWFYILGGLLVYGYSMAFHVQLVIGGKLNVQYGVDDYIEASLVLYLDIIKIFIRILVILAKIVGKEGDRKKN